MFRFYYEIKHHFDAAHHLPDYPGKCSQVHGHRWEVTVEITIHAKQCPPESGMFVDFLKVKRAIDLLDHCNLNDFFKQPTAENIAMRLVSVLDQLIDGMYSRGLRVTVQESPGNKVSVEEWIDLYEVVDSVRWDGSETFTEGDRMEMPT